MVSFSFSELTDLVNPLAIALEVSVGVGLELVDELLVLAPVPQDLRHGLQLVHGLDQLLEEEGPEGRPHRAPGVKRVVRGREGGFALLPGTQEAVAAEVSAGEGFKDRGGKKRELVQWKA